MAWHACDQPDCTGRFKTAGTLKRHKAAIHDLDVTWHACDQSDCTGRFKTAGELKQHKAHVHNLDVTWHACDHPDCTERFKAAGTLKTHKAHAHDLDVTWHACDHPDCTVRCKRAGDLKSHKAAIHDLDVTWHACDQPDCTVRFKEAGNLKSHKAHVHDIGDFVCEYCCGNRNSKIVHDDTNKGQVHICRACFRKAVGKDSRIELEWSDYVDRELGTDFLISNDKSLRSQGGCSRRRPDKFYASSDGVEVDECDEYQHTRTGSSDYTCDESRLSEIYDEPAICGKPMVVIRWNPHSYTAPDGAPRYDKRQRLALFVALKRRLRERSARDDTRPKIEVFYMFYDRSNPLICKSLPVHFVNTWADLEQIKA